MYVEYEESVYYSRYIDVFKFSATVIRHAYISIISPYRCEKHVVLSLTLIHTNVHTHALISTYVYQKRRTSVAFYMYRNIKIHYFDFYESVLERRDNLKFAAFPRHVPGTRTLLFAAGAALRAQQTPSQTKRFTLQCTPLRYVACLPNVNHRFVHCRNYALICYVTTYLCRLTQL